MKEILLVFLGGGAGSTLRYLVSLIIPKAGETGGFPVATFLVNILGCFLLGLLTQLVSRDMLSSGMRLLLCTGLCGGFTTFSTFTEESFQMAGDGRIWMYALYVGASVLLGLCAAMAGHMIGRNLF